MWTLYPIHVVLRLLPKVASASYGELIRRRQVGRRAPTNPVALEVELGQPDPTQDRDRGDLPQPGRRRVAPEGVQEAVSVGADDLRVGGAGLLALGQARLLHPRRVAVEPLGRGLPTEPPRRDPRECVEGGAERLADQLQAVEVAGGGQDVGRVGALAGAGLEQAAVLAGLQHLVQEAPFGPAGGEATAELGEDGEVEAGVVELEPEGVLPVDATADGVGGPAIGEILGELHHRDQGELPWGQAGLPAPGIEVGEVAVAEDRAEVVAEPEIGISLGEGGTGDAGGQFGDVRDGAGLQGHGCTSGRAALWCNSFQYNALTRMAL